MWGCCAPCQESNTTQLEFDQPIGLGEVFSPGAVEQKRFIQSPSNDVVVSLDQEPRQSGLSTLPPPSGLSSATIPESPKGNSNSPTGGATILSHLHSGTFQRSTSITSILKPTKTPSFTSVDDLEEQSRIIEMVSAFAKRAVKGCTCTLIEERTGKLIPANYYVDKALQHFVVVFSDEPLSKDYKRIECPIAAVESIYTFADNSNGHLTAHTSLNPGLLEVLSINEKERLFNMSYYCSTGGMTNLTILEDSSSTLKATTDSLRILSLPAKPDGNSST